MEYAKDEIFKIRYNTKLERLQTENKNWTCKFLNKLKKHKLMTTILITLIMFSTANIIMIYNFMQILQEM